FCVHRTASSEICTLSLHDALPIFEVDGDPVERLELEPGGASRPLEQLAALPDDDALLALALHPDQRADGEPVLVALVAFDLDGQDRKSTRLNSSHVKISYAVFCLK